MTTRKKWCCYERIKMIISTIRIWELFELAYVYRWSKIFFFRACIKENVVLTFLILDFFFGYIFGPKKDKLFWPVLILMPSVTFCPEWRLKHFINISWYSSISVLAKVFNPSNPLAENLVDNEHKLLWSLSWGTFTIWKVIIMLLSLSWTSQVISNLFNKLCWASLIYWNLWLKWELIFLERSENIYTNWFLGHK